MISNSTGVFFVFFIFLWTAECVGIWLLGTPGHTDGGFFFHELLWYQNLKAMLSLIFVFWKTINWYFINFTTHSFVLLVSVICFLSKHTALPEYGWNCWLNLFNKYFSYYFNLEVNFQTKLIIPLIKAFIHPPRPNAYSYKLKQNILRVTFSLRIHFLI